MGLAPHELTPDFFVIKLISYYILFQNFIIYARNSNCVSILLPHFRGVGCTSCNLALKTSSSSIWRYVADFCQLCDFTSKILSISSVFVFTFCWDFHLKIFIGLPKVFTIMIHNLTLKLLLNLSSILNRWNIIPSHALFQLNSFTNALSITCLLFKELNALPDVLAVRGLRLHPLHPVVQPPARQHC